MVKVALAANCSARLVGLLGMDRVVLDDHLQLVSQRLSLILFSSFCFHCYVNACYVFSGSACPEGIRTDPENIDFTCFYNEKKHGSNMTSCDHRKGPITA